MKYSYMGAESPCDFSRTVEADDEEEAINKLLDECRGHIERYHADMTAPSESDMRETIRAALMPEEVPEGTSVT